MKRHQRCPTHPGILLREDVMPALGMTKSQTAEVLGVSRTYLYKLLDGEVPMSVEMCLKVGELAGNGARLWMNMQSSYNLWFAEHDPKVKKSIDKISSFRERVHA